MRAVRSAAWAGAARGMAVVALVACGGSGADDGNGGDGTEPPIGTPSAPVPGAPPDRTGTGPKLDCGGGGACIVTSMAMGTLSACVLLQDRTVACYGGGVVGTLGRGEAVDGDPYPQRVKGLTDVTAVFAGAYNVCAVQSSGALSCWGADQSANPFSTRPGALAPARIEGLEGVKSVSIAISHTCALTTAGEVYCWGSNYLGELGDGTFDNASTPVKVQGLSDVAQIAVGNEFSCARTNGGEVLCWGGNAKGQLGTTDEGHPLPQAVPGIANAVDLSATASAETACATIEGGTVTCWGEKWKGPVAGVSDVKSLRVGWNHACVLRNDGKVTCWGDNGKGQLGSGTKADGSTGPHEVVGVVEARLLVATGNSSCTVFQDGSLACWGDNTRGQLGDGATNTSTPTPVRVRH